MFMIQIYINLFQSLFRLSLVIIVEILSYLIIVCQLIDGQKLIRAYVSLFYCHAVLK